MSIILYLFFFLIGIISTLLLLALFLKKEHYVKREIIIHAPIDKVFAFLRMLKNQEKFNPWAQTDPNRNWEYKGTDGEVGFIIAWNGNKKAGQGEKEIMHIIENKKIETQIRFIKPMKTFANITMETDYMGETETKVSFTNAGTLSYPMNLFIPMAEKNFPKAIDKSLLTLKELMEKPE